MRRTTLALSAALLPIALGLSPFLACSSNDTNETADAADVSDVGVCPTSVDVSAGKYPHSALPTGQACTPSTSCHIPIDDCPSDFSTTPIGNNLAEYECLCTGGVWACSIAVPVDSECSEAGASSPDAEVDSPAEAALSDAGDGASEEASVDSAIDSVGDSAGDSTLDAPADSAPGPDASPFDAASE